MKINPNVVNLQQNKQENVKKADQEVKPITVPQKEAEYIPSAAGEEKKANYNKPVGNKVDANLIAKLKNASEEKYQNLRRMVEEMLSRQGMTFRDLVDGKTVKVDEATRLEAQEMISEGGEFSAEAVSDRLVDFAKAVSGGDKSKLNVLIGAIDEGFSQARKILGGSLPEISQRTYDLIMEKLDVWKNEE